MSHPDAPESPSQQHAFGIAGLPGSGKSTAAEIIASECMHNFERAYVHEVSDFVREYFNESGWSGDDNELGRIAAKKKERRGNDFFVRQMALSYYARPYHPVISGLRSPEEAEAIRDVYGDENTTIIAIWTMPDIRFERKYGEPLRSDHPKLDEFQERNEREIWDWRCIDFFMEGGSSDIILSNNTLVADLEDKLSSLVTDALSLRDGYYKRPVSETFPSDDPEAVAQYL